MENIRLIDLSESVQKPHSQRGNLPGKLNRILHTIQRVKLDPQITCKNDRLARTPHHHTYKYICLLKHLHTNVAVYIYVKLLLSIKMIERTYGEAWALTRTSILITDVLSFDFEY